MRNLGLGDTNTIWTVTERLLRPAKLRCRGGECQNREGERRKQQWRSERGKGTQGGEAREIYHRWLCWQNKNALHVPSTPPHGGFEQLGVLSRVKFLVRNCMKHAPMASVDRSTCNDNPNTVMQPNASNFTHLSTTLPT